MELSSGFIDAEDLKCAFLNLSFMKQQIIVTIILARGGSKGVPRKNIRLLAGRPLIYYAIHPSLQCKLISHTFVSTEDEEIATVARQLGAKVIPRPKELAQDTTPDLPCLQQAIEY